MVPSALPVLALLLCLLQPPWAQSRCYFQAKTPCRYAGRTYRLGESWLGLDCQLCTCLHPVGVGCCEITQHPIDFPSWCEARYDAETCQISVCRKPIRNCHVCTVRTMSGGRRSPRPSHIDRLSHPSGQLEEPNYPVMQYGRPNGHGPAFLFFLQKTTSCVQSERLLRITQRPGRCQQRKRCGQKGLISKR